MTSRSERGRPREYDANDCDVSADDGLTQPPDGYPEECAWLQPKELMARNEDLARFGKRICKTHQGHALPLDTEHFGRYRKAGKWYFRYCCKDCSNAVIRKWRRERYHNDDAYRETEQERLRLHKRQLQVDAEYRKRRADAARNRRLRLKQQRLTDVLVTHSLYEMREAS